MIFREKTAILFCLSFTMDHSKFISSIQKEEFISEFKDSADYFIQQQSLIYMCIMKYQIL